MWISFNYTGELDISFDTLHADPELILRKLPRVDFMTRMDEDDFRVTLKPFVFHKALSVTAVGHINLSKTADAIVWSESTQHSNTECNGKITGTATRSESGSVLINGTISLNHPWVNGMTWFMAKPIVDAAAAQFLDEFKQNFRNDDFRNPIPEA